MTIAADWISAAYNRSSANDPGKLAQDPELLAHLNRVFQRLWALWARARPDEAGSLATLTWGGGPASVTLPTDTVDVGLLLNGAGGKVHLIPANEVLRMWHLPPSVYRLGTKLVSRAFAGDPIAGDTLALVLLDAPAPLLLTSTVIDARYPTRHHQLVIDCLALYLSIKDAGREEGDRAALLVDLKLASVAFAAEYHLAPGAVEWVHGDAMRTAVPA